MENLQPNMNCGQAASAIKAAVLRSQYRAISVVNREQLSLYYGIGRYVSQNSRKDFWGTGAIEQISEQLQKELPGLRGFSPENMRKMRHFYEEWEMVINWPPMATDLQVSEIKHITIQSPMATKLDLEVNENLLLMPIPQPLAAEFKLEEFLQVSFSHHIEIINKTKSLQARLFYIHECVTHFWNKYTLRNYLKADLYNKRGTMPNNFSKTISDTKLALRAVAMFKDEYLLDYINVEHIDEGEEDQDERILEHEIVNNIKT